MKLTDNEKRDAIKLIEEGKTLPEKYRFLLFDESRQIELTWNGKFDEVTNIVLPFQIIENIDDCPLPLIFDECNVCGGSGLNDAGWCGDDVPDCEGACGGSDIDCIEDCFEGQVDNCNT